MTLLAAGLENFGTGDGRRALGDLEDLFLEPEAASVTYLVQG